MAEPVPFQYVVVRVVPRVERGEQFNAGVVLFCPKLDFLPTGRATRLSSSTSVSLNVSSIRLAVTSIRSS